MSSRAILLLGLSISMLPFAATSQTIPATADTGRIETPEREMIPYGGRSDIQMPRPPEASKPPEGADDIAINIKKVRVLGAKMFTADVLEPLFSEYLNRDVTLDKVWEIAHAITLHYRKNGYFLSRAYVPPQEVEDGIVRIRVIEGYVQKIEMNEDDVSYFYIRKLIESLAEQRPAKSDILESIMLELNATPGIRYRAVLEPTDTEGAVKLGLEKLDEPDSGRITIDNFGSRFLGPYQATATYTTSLIPMQETTFSTLASLPDSEELGYFAINHLIPIYPEWTLMLSGNYASSEPGASLEDNQIQSNALTLGVEATYQPIRKRDENLRYRFIFDGKNSNGDILTNTPLTRDRIRTLRVGAAYDAAGSMNSYNYYNVMLSRGVGWFGGSNAGAANLSRAAAKPTFTKIEFDYTRQQRVLDEWLAIGRVSGQWSSDPLFSAEEFGYGGSQFGRAYDPSEITGDRGLKAGLEVRYMALDRWQDSHISPYVFYDAGKVWNEDVGTRDATASSAGMGVRFNHISGASANLGVAWPLTREAANPLYGDGDSPRFLLQTGYNF